MKTLIRLFFVINLLVTLASCEKNASTPSGDSNDQIKVELFNINDFNLKTGEEDDDDPVPDTISGLVSSSSQSPVIAGIDLVNATNSNLIESTTTDSNGYFYFYNVETGSFVVIVKVDGEIMETIYVTI